MVCPPDRNGGASEGRDVTLPDGRYIASKDYTEIPRPPRRVVIAGDNDTPSCWRGLAEKPTCWSTKPPTPGTWQSVLDPGPSTALPNR